MGRPAIPKGRMKRLFAIGVVSVSALTVGIAMSGVIRSFSDEGKPRVEPVAEAASAATPPSSPRRSSAAAAKPAAPAADQNRQSAPLSKPGAALSDLRVKRVLKIDGPLRHGDYVWDDKGVPEGRVFITIDMKAQTLSVFRAGYEIGVAVILYGADNKPSPVGVFPIMEKEADHVSNLYNSAPMPYAMRLTADGVFIHGSDVIWGNATHGCFGVPTAFAKKLFGVAKVGDAVIVTDGKMMNLG